MTRAIDARLPIDPRRYSDVFRGSLAVAAGAASWHQLRSRQFVRLVRDVYLPSTITVTHDLRCRAASLIIPAGAAITGRSAATLLGVPLALPWHPVEVAVPEECRFGPVQGLRVRRVVAGKVECGEHAGVPVTVPQRMALDLGMGRNFVEAVADLEDVLRVGLVGADEVARFLATSHERGVRRARRAFSCCDARAESRHETRVRLLLVFAGLRPVPQFEVWDEVGFVARVDLAFPLQRVAVECHDTWRTDPELPRREYVRLGEAGWQVVRVAAAALRDDPHAVLAAVRAALARVGRQNNHRHQPRDAVRCASRASCGQACEKPRSGRMSPANDVTLRNCITLIGGQSDGSKVVSVASPRTI